MFHLSYVIPFRLLDKGFIELIGPLGLAEKLHTFSKIASRVQTGLIYHYTFIILIGIIIYINLIFFLENLCNYFTFEILMYYFFLFLAIF